MRLRLPLLPRRCPPTSAAPHPSFLPPPLHADTLSGAGRTQSPSRWCRAGSPACCWPCRAAASCCTRCRGWGEVPVVGWDGACLNPGSLPRSIAHTLQLCLHPHLTHAPMHPCTDPAHGWHGGGGGPWPPAAGAAGGVHGHSRPHEPAPGAALHPHAHGRAVQVGPRLPEGLLCGPGVPLEGGRMAERTAPACGSRPQLWCWLPPGQAP